MKFHSKYIKKIQYLQFVSLTRGKVYIGSKLDISTKPTWSQSFAKVNDKYMYENTKLCESFTF